MALLLRIINRCRTFLLGLAPFVRIVSLVLGETIIFLTAAICRLGTRARNEELSGEYFPVALHAGFIDKERAYAKAISSVPVIRVSKDSQNSE